MTNNTVNDTVTDYINDKSDKNLVLLYKVLCKYINLTVFAIRKRYNLQLDSLDIEDIVSDTFFNLLKFLNEDKYDETIAKFSTVAFTASRNNTISFVKRKYKFDKLDKLSIIPVSPDEFEFEDNSLLLDPEDLSIILDEIIEKHPSSAKYITAIKIFENTGMEEYCKENNLKPTSVRTRAFEGRKMVKNYIMNKFPGRKIVLNIDI